MDSIIFLEPCELLAHILSSVGLYLSDGFFFGDAAVEVGKQLLIAHGVE